MGTGERRDAGTSIRFYVEGLLKAEFSECSGLQVEVEVMEYQEGGTNDYVHKLPGRVKVSNVTLRRGIVKSDDLWKWFTDVAAGRIERKNFDVVLCDDTGQERQKWSFEGAYPVKWVGPTLKAGDNTMAIETLELAHRGMQLA